MRTESISVREALKKRNRGNSRHVLTRHVRLFAQYVAVVRIAARDLERRETEQVHAQQPRELRGSDSCGFLKEHF